MATNDDPEFGERFSELMNALQAAVLLAGKHATDTRLATADADALYRSITNAVEAARQLRHLRPNGGEQA